MLKILIGYTSSMAQKLLSTLTSIVTSSDQPSPAPGQLPYSIHFRTLGNIAYFMGSLNTERSVYEGMEKRIVDALKL